MQIMRCIIIQRILIRMMSFISKKVTKAYKISKSAITGKKDSMKQVKAYQLVEKIRKFKGDVVPSSKMNEIAVLSFEYEQFELICELILSHLHSFLEANARSVRNQLVLCHYLIKHGAGGFVDEFRESIHLFEKFTATNYLGIENKSEKMNFYRDDIRDRAAHIVILLNDKNKLIKQKELAMLVKQKMMIMNKGKENQPSLSNSPNLTDANEENQNSFVDNYIWKYVNKFDKKLDEIAEVLADQAAKFILEDEPEEFEIDEEQQDKNPKIYSEANLEAEKEVKKNQEKFFERKNVKKTTDSNLLDL